MQLYLPSWVQVLSHDNIYSSTSKGFYQWLERHIKKTVDCCGGCQHCLMAFSGFFFFCDFLK